MRQIFIAIGGNLPHEPSPGEIRSPLQICRDAVTALRALPDLEISAVSPWYESAPVPPSGQPPYVNGVVQARSSLAPETLLARLQDIENRSGRTRSTANAARTLDLDIIDMGGIVRTYPDPILPHPRACQRAFVLRPLHDIAPDWRDPVSGRHITDLLRDVADQQISPLDKSAIS
ncbi:2-amino-4-hydroxy-6-hydroxymethyldihydropteridine diphosphokinase [Acetobacter sp. AN02]|uniref:2-amino-4-hydroxy-6- hydroxymethyldihydropteridine diphosphokinase n=1 Tax=Acetobacter sp. AN02 TaxID=2894186 RepID=UPI0024345677|nr:2-amino-4-hydroxy-6-hydroxymethyldihydropteridine diphosphokinase [Acetobacter sp. AN02]MDG6095382.1 2-amino-4-hydroxy-6-hydroxymethyldihydropteridine diphosphokinase [Acetobacter sp. AN02]